MLAANMSPLAAKYYLEMTPKRAYTLNGTTVLSHVEMTEELSSGEPSSSLASVGYLPIAVTEIGETCSVSPGGGIVLLPPHIDVGKDLGDAVAIGTLHNFFQGLSAPPTQPWGEGVADLHQGKSQAQQAAEDHNVPFVVALMDAIDMDECASPILEEWDASVNVITDSEVRLLALANKAEVLLEFGLT